MDRLSTAEFADLEVARERPAKSPEALPRRRGIPGPNSSATAGRQAIRAALLYTLQLSLNTSGLSSRCATRTPRSAAAPPLPKPALKDQRNRTAEKPERQQKELGR
jgi:hypothetical protein